MIPRTVSLAVVLALGAFGAQAADMIYKSTMPDGRVMYGESPMQGAKRVDKVAPPPEHSGVITVTSEDRSRASNIPQPTGATVSVIKPKERDVTSLSNSAATQGYQVNQGRQLPKRDY